MKKEELSSKKCEVCGFSWELCICNLIKPVPTKTRVCVIMHVREQWWSKRISNTGKLAGIGLANGEIKVWGLKDRPFDSTYFEGDEYRNLFLFPSDNSITLSRQLVSETDRKIRLVVPDGNWRQAGNMSNRIKNFKGIECVKLPPGEESIYKLRRNPNPDRISTFEAILRALDIIEDDFDKGSLEHLFDVMIKRALMNRGKIKPDKSFL